LEMVSITVDNAGNVNFAWSSQLEGRVSAPTYDVLNYDQTLTPGGTWTVLHSNIGNGGATTASSDSVAGMSANMRFYRPVINGQTIAGTVNLGAVAKYTLPEGRSYIAIPLNASVSTTLLNILGTDQLPGGDSLASATTVDVWDQDTQSLSDRYWLSDVNGAEGWYETNAVTSADNVVIDTSKGIIINIPVGEGSQTLYVAGMVPEIADTQTIKGEGFSLASLHFPQAIDVSLAGLVESGFQGHSGFSILSDWVMLFNPATGNFDTKIWYETGTPAWRNVDGVEEVTLDLQPGEPFLIRRFAASDFVWTNSLPTTPTIEVTAVEPVAAEQEGSPACFRISRTGSLDPVTIEFSVLDNPNNLLPNADPSEYSFRHGTFSNEVTTKVHIPFGVAYADVMVEAVDDGVPEAAESIRFSIDAPGGYKVGPNTDAIIKIGDKGNIESNVVVYVAYLVPSTLAQGDSGGYGIATIRLRGDRDIGELTLTFSGLTTPQSDVHIHWHDNGNAVEDLPLGQISSYQWEMEPIGGFTTELDVINALQNSKLYINVHSDRYPHGEIVGTFVPAVGSTLPQDHPDPPVFTNITATAMQQDIARFLNQATFGSTTGLMAEVQSYIDVHGGGTNRIAGMSAWLDDQINSNVTEQIFIETICKTKRIQGAYPTVSDRREEHHGWAAVARHGKAQLRHRAGTALSEILVMSPQPNVVRQFSNIGTSHYYDMLAKNAFGSYSNLLYKVSRHANMGIFLSHLSNDKEQVDGGGDVISSPDENYAREIMQLFTIGLLKKHPDGTLHLGANGLPQETYDDTVISHVAKVFTGWGIAVTDESTENTNFYTSQGNRDQQVRLTTPMKMFQDRHDETLKTVLDGQTIPAGQSGDKDLKDFIEILHNHGSTAPNISKKLIQFFVTSNPSPGYINRVSDAWTSSNGNMGDVFKAILLDYEARTMDPSMMDDHYSYGKMKEPMLAYASLMRLFSAESSIPFSDLSPFGYPVTELNKFPVGATETRTNPALSQLALYATSVFNFFAPNFSPPGDMSAAGLVGPEFELNTGAKMYKRYDEYNRTAFSGTFGERQKNYLDLGYSGGDYYVYLDFQNLVDIYDAEGTAALGAEAVIDFMDLHLNGGRLKRLYESAATPNPRSMLIDLGENLNATYSGSAADTLQRVKSMYYAFAASPDFGIQR